MSSDFLQAANSNPAFPLNRIRFDTPSRLVILTVHRSLTLNQAAALIEVQAPMKTQYYTATSLDGFIATADHSLDWLFPLGDLNESSYPDFIAEVGALAMGSATYEWLLRHADKVIAETGSAWPYTQPTWIFTSRSLPAIEGADIRFVNGDVRLVHADMLAAAGGKNIWIVGGGDLAGQFYDAGLLDELIIQIGSVTLGAGKSLFPRQVLSPTLRLVSVRQMGASMAEIRYTVHRGGVSDTIPVSVLS